MACFSSFIFNQTSMSELETKAEALTEHVTDYVDTYIKLTGLKATEKATEAATVSVTIVLLCLFSLLVLVFVGFGLASWIEESLSSKAAYFIVSGSYIVLGIIVMLCRKKFIFPVLKDQIISKIYASKH
jgi:Putative Actinobacterial Holin-X, holin superfamily III